MATVKLVKSAIKSSEYVVKSIKYILSPETKSGNEKCVQSSFLNCCNDSIDSLVTQFDVTRFAFGKNDKILAHHYVQSFSPNEKITPELAHKIGEELAECVAPGFQVIVATHVDRDHIHNHFLINSVSSETGSKWLGNQSSNLISLAFMPFSEYMNSNRTRNAVLYDFIVAGRFLFYVS